MSEPSKPSILQSAHEQADRLAQAEREDPEKIHVTADVAAEGVEVAGSVDITKHAAIGGFWSRSWSGVQKFGARFKFSK